MPSVQTVNTVVLGLKGNGKSTWVDLYSRTFQRVLIVDTLAEYHALQVPVQNLDGWAAGERFRLSVVPEGEADVVTCCRAAERLGNLLLVLEEVGTWCESKDVLLQLRQLVRTSRHAGVSLCSVSHRASEVPRLVTFQADRFVMFHTHEPADLDNVRKLTGNTDLVAVLRTLPKFTYAQYDTDGGRLRFYDLHPAHVPQVPVPRRDMGLNPVTFAGHWQNPGGCGTM